MRWAACTVWRWASIGAALALPLGLLMGASQRIILV
jgi:hypothetical protein